MKLEHAFEVPASPDQTMALMLDPERVVPCMPGANLKEVVDERQLEGRRWRSSSARSGCSSWST